MPSTQELAFHRGGGRDEQTGYPEAKVISDYEGSWWLSFLLFTDTLL